MAQVCVCVCVGGRGPLIFSRIRRLGPFWGSKILNFNVFLGGKEMLWIFLWDHHITGLVFGVISVYSRVFS